MKKIITAIFATVIAQFSFAQMHISTNLREDYDWSSSSLQWVFNVSDPASATLFDFNKEMTMFTHTTASLTSTYYIKSGTYDKSKNLWEYQIVSDVGNKYRLLLDPDNNNLRFIGTRSDGSMYLVRHTIKRLWKDE